MNRKATRHTDHCTCMYTFILLLFKIASLSSLNLNWKESITNWSHVFPCKYFAEWSTLRYFPPGLIVLVLVKFFFHAFPLNSTRPCVCMMQLKHPSSQQPWKISWLFFSCYSSEKLQCRCTFLMAVVFGCIIFRASKRGAHPILWVWTWLSASPPFSSLGCNTFKTRAGF